MSQRCFILGYGPGIGEGAARAFSAAGYELVLFSRSGRSRESTPGRAVDVGDALALRASLREALAEGPPEVVIYNAVAFRQATPLQVRPEELVADFQVNVVGALVTAQTLLPAMQRGSLLFTGGGWALYPDPAVASTAIGKAGLRHAALMLAKELQGSPLQARILSVLGAVQEGTAFDPGRIGEALLALHQAPGGKRRFSLTAPSRPLLGSESRFCGTIENRRGSSANRDPWFYIREPYRIRQSFSQLPIPGRHGPDAQATYKGDLHVRNSQSPQPNESPQPD